MTAALLSRTRKQGSSRPEQPFLDSLSLPRGRAHEVCGGARRFLACLIGGQMQGPIYWIAPGWQADRLNPESVTQLLNPGRITFVEPNRAEDLLWCMEEALRSGIVPLVVADIPAPPGLTSVRRLHLAAETGASETGNWPLGLILTPGSGGAQGIESRWHMAPQHDERSRQWRLDRLRARTAPQKSWQVYPSTGAFKLRPALSDSGL